MAAKSFAGIKSTYLLGAIVAGFLVALIPVVIMAFDPGPPSSDPNFEIDVPAANALDESIYAGDDWDTVYKCFAGGDGYNATECAALGGLNVELINTTGILHDHNMKTIFWKGGSKDIRDVTQWQWKDGSVPDKDEISHAGAAAYAVDDELVMYIFADRYSNDGDAQMGAWFFQDVVDTAENSSVPNQGAFSGRHINGDILWLGHFSGGGVVASMQVLKWNAKNPPIGDPPFDQSCVDEDRQEKGTNLCLVAEGPGGAGTGYFASVTTDTQPQVDRASPWDYTPKQGDPNFFPYNSFMEGGINLTQILGETPCFSSYLIETRSSTSVTAQLKDFTLGRIDTCKIDVRKSCTSTLAAGGASIDHHFTIEARNVGFADLTSVDLADDYHSTNPWTWTGTLSHDSGWQTVADYTINNTTQEPSNTVTAVGRTGGGYATAPATDTVTCPAVPLEPGLEVTKYCDKTKLVQDTTNNRLWVEVSYKGTVCNTGDVRLTNVLAWDTRDSVQHPITNLSKTTLNPRTGPEGDYTYDCATYSASYFPDTAVGGGVTQEYVSDSACFMRVDTQQWTDEVDASADPVLGAGPIEALAVERTCPLCPNCEPSQ